MVRTYKKKTDRKATTPRKLSAALSLVRDGYSFRQAVKLKGVNRQTLWKAFHNAKKAGNLENPNVAKLSYGVRAVFTKEQEDTIAEYCTALALIRCGLSVLKVREIGYEVAEKNKLRYPKNWDRLQLAGRDWFKGFLKRHPNLSIRKPEGCSIARASAFNKPNIERFYMKLEEVMERHTNFRNGSRTYNLDETNCSTVQNIRKVVPPKGLIQLHQIKSAERGTGVTTCCIIGAQGVLIPPVMIFPRLYFKSSMVKNAHPGTLGLANQKDYRTRKTSLGVLQHFEKHTHSSKEDPTLLLVDNVETHLSGAAVEFCRDNGITLFTFLPHCTHRLQPLDVGVFGPFKTYYDAAISSFMLSNPGVPTTIYHVASFVNEALSRSCTPANIISSFKKPGIVPFNRSVFQDRNFVMSTLTEKPDPTSENDSINIDGPVNDKSAAQPDTFPVGDKQSSLPGFISPAMLNGYPKAKPKETSRKPRRKGRCMIATDTPNKNEIQERED